MEEDKKAFVAQVHRVWHGTISELYILFRSPAASDIGKKKHRFSSRHVRRPQHEKNYHGFRMAALSMKMSLLVRKKGGLHEPFRRFGIRMLHVAKGSK